jgi:hypothetical protein
MTTLEPLRTKRRIDCGRCLGEATHRLYADGKKTNVVVCCWCKRSLEHGHLVLSGNRLIPPPRFRAKRGSES